jgi:signal transduction histidine kinase
MVVPCVVLVALGVRIIVQQEELAEKHAADERRLLVAEFERALLTKLDQLRQDPADPAIALAALVSDGRLVLPWERTAPDAAADPAFHAMLTLAEREEFGAQRLDRAELAIRSALRVAKAPRDVDQGRLVLARVLVKANRSDEASALHATLLREPLTIVDEQSVPFALYAAEQLVKRGRIAEREQQAIDSLIGSVQPQVLPPVAWYLLRSVDRGQHTWLDARIAEVEQALALQRDFSTVQALWHSSNMAWMAYGTRPWLVGLRHATADGVVAVRAGEVVAAIRSSSDRFKAVDLAIGPETGERLGDQLPGLRVRVTGPSGPAADLRLQRVFYGGALALVLGVTFFGAFLLWRDVRRELRLADLRSQFVSSVSHELKTPLTAIRMFAETLRLGRADGTTRDEYLDTIVNESERLTRLLNNVLDFSKIEQGRKAYRLDYASLAEVGRAAARAMAYPLEQHGFVLRLEIDESVPAARVDADALEQAILNLLTNAMKYSGDGREIDLRLTREGGQAIISVRDCGVGIPLHEQTRIFEKFYRVQTPENQRIPGTGLGLTLVDHIARAHEGSVRVDSTPGQGSTFSIRVPFAGAAS